MNGRAIPGAYLFRLYVCDKEMSWPHHIGETHQPDWVVYVRDSDKFRLTNVIPERIIFVSRGITLLRWSHVFLPVRAVRFRSTTQYNEFYVHVTVHRNKFLCNKTNQTHQFHKFSSSWNSTCFRQFVCPSSEVYSLYTQQWYMSYRFVDNRRAGPGWILVLHKVHNKFVCDRLSISGLGVGAVCGTVCNSVAASLQRLTLTCSIESALIAQ